MHYQYKILKNNDLKPLYLQVKNSKAELYLYITLQGKLILSRTEIKNMYTIFLYTFIPDYDNQLSFENFFWLIDRLLTELYINMEAPYET